MVRLKPSSGLSLIEIGIIMVIVSLALAPVVQIIGGPLSPNGEGNITQINGLKSRETILANSQIEKVLSGDFQSMACGNDGKPMTDFDPATDLPTVGGKKAYKTCSVDGAQPLYYQWTVVNLDGGSQLPKMNHYYQATINVLSKPGGRILLTMPVGFLYNQGAYRAEELTTGVMFVFDTSASMQTSCKNCRLQIYYGSSDESVPRNMFVLPWMYYRYDASLFTGNDWGPNFTGQPLPAGVALNMWDDSQLDLTYGHTIQSGGLPPDLSDPNSTTPFNEKFPYAKGVQSILGTGNCTLSDTGKWAFNQPGNDPNLAWVFLPRVPTDTVDALQPLNVFCSAKADEATWSSWMSNNMPRIEAVRTASINLLLKLEQNPEITKKIQVGFLPWSIEPDVVRAVPLESAQTVSGVPGLHFKQLRERLLWINRADPSQKDSPRPIRMSRDTRIDLALQEAQKELLKNNSRRRIIVLLTDGAPHPSEGNNTPEALIDYANSIGNAGSLDTRTTIFTVGLIEADEDLLKAIANNTPGGESFYAHDIADLTPIFESIAYQIQKYALLNTSDRYQIDLE